MPAEEAFGEQAEERVTQKGLRMGNKQRALLVVNGELTREQLARVDAGEFETVICTDGAAGKLMRMGLRPHVVVGDLDSLAAQGTALPPSVSCLHRPSQAVNDLEKALMYCQEQGFQQVVVIGVGGGRLDHAINNLSVLSRYDRIFHLEIHDACSRIFIVRRSWQRTVAPGQLISLIPIGRVEGVTTRGLQYPLKDEPLVFGWREGLSNVASEPEVKITLKSGLLIVFLILRA